MRFLIRALARLADPFLPPRLATFERRDQHTWREPIRPKQEAKR